MIEGAIGYYSHFHIEVGESVGEHAVVSSASLKGRRSR